jgi:hypothetical protein
LQKSYNSVTLDTFAEPSKGTQARRPKILPRIRFKMTF